MLLLGLKLIAILLGILADIAIVGVPSLIAIFSGGIVITVIGLAGCVCLLAIGIGLVDWAECLVKDYIDEKEQL